MWLGRADLAAAAIALGVALVAPQGAAATGLRPVVELMFVDFMGVCFDQIFNQAAKFRYMFGGKATTPPSFAPAICGLRSRPMRLSP